MDIELIATSTLKLSISQCDILSPYIDEKDKEPSWDGSVYIFRNKIKKKDGLRRVSVQVKGKIYKNLPKGQITYPVEIVDMNNYLYNGGVIYFVVCIKKNRTEAKIYYSTLTPVKLSIYLHEASQQKTKNIPFLEFPDDNNQKATIFLNFYEDCLKQASFAGRELPTLDELINSNSLDHLSLSVSGFGLNNMDPCHAFLNNEVYLYAHVKGSAIPQPLEIIPQKMHISKQENYPISVKEQQFYSNYTIIYTKEENFIRIGKSIVFSISPDGIGQLNLTPSGTLKECLHDMAFFIACYENNGFTIHDWDITLKKTEGTSIETTQKIFEQYCQLKEALEILGVSEELDIAAMNDADRNIAASLISAFIHKQPLTNPGVKHEPVFLLKLANLNLVLMAIPTEDENTYLLADYFKTHLDLYYKDDNDENHPISQYNQLKWKNLIELSNINYDTIVADQKNIGNYETANLFLLEMIFAYDAKPTSKLYEAMHELSAWLLSEATEVELPYGICLLNHLQIIKRNRTLNVEEIRELYHLIDSQPEKRVLVGAYLLLDSQSDAEIHFFSLEDAQQEEFKKYPIYKFWHKKE